MRKQKAAYIAHVLDSLCDVPGLTYRSMFGGYGLYSQGVFFGLVWKGGLYFRVDEVSEKKYIAKGAQPFVFSETQKTFTYYEVPETVLKNAKTAAQWAQTAIEVQKARALKKEQKRRRRPPKTKSGL